MAEEKYEPAKQDNNKDAWIKPDPETLKTTDPQEHMEGPVSSIMKGIENLMEKPDEKDEEKDK